MNAPSVTERPKPKTIVIVGQNMSGKSSFVQMLHEYAGIPVPDKLKAGGSCFTPCTKEVSTYTLQLRQSTFASPKGVSTWRSLVDAQHPIERTLVGVSITLRVTDTPGFLDDASKMEPEYGLNLLRALVEFGDVTAVVIFINGQMPMCTASCVFNYVKSILHIAPQLRESIVVFHSNHVLQQKLWDEPKEYERMEVRIGLFRAATSLDCPFFVDCLGEEVFERDHRIEAIHDSVNYAVVTSFLKYLETRNDVKIRKLRCHKTPTIREGGKLLATTIKNRFAELPKLVGAVDAPLGEDLALDARRVKKTVVLNTPKLVLPKGSLRVLLRNAVLPCILSQKACFLGCGKKKPAFKPRSSSIRKSSREYR